MSPVARCHNADESCFGMCPCVKCEKDPCEEDECGVICKWELEDKIEELKERIKEVNKLPKSITPVQAYKFALEHLKSFEEEWNKFVKDDVKKE